MADTLIAPAPLRSPLVDDKTPGLPTRAWAAWWQRVAEVVGDLAERLLAIEGMLIDVVAGVGEPEKALVLDENGDIVSGLRNLAIDGTVSWDELELSKDATDVLALKGDADQDVALRVYANATDYSSYGPDAEVFGGVSIGATAATAGDLRLSQGAAVRARNAANDGDMDVIEILEMTGGQNAIKIGGGDAVLLFKGTGVLPADLADGYFWVQYTGSSASLRIRVGGATQVIASVSF